MADKFTVSGSDLTSKKSIIDFYRSIVEFPSYYQYNWDSFDEILNEVLDMSNRYIEIEHTGKTNLSLEDFEAYLLVLAGACEDYSHFDAKFDAEFLSSIILRRRRA